VRVRERVCICASEREHDIERERERVYAFVNERENIYVGERVMGGGVERERQRDQQNEWEQKWLCYHTKANGFLFLSESVACVYKYECVAVCCSVLQCVALLSM